MSSSLKIEATYVVDTHALIWYLTNDKKLGKSASQIFAAAERGETLLVISAISIAEMYWMNQKRKIFANFAKTYEDLKANPQYQLYPFHPNDVLEFDLNAAVPEMHDRMIAGLARRLAAPLITMDPLIIAAKVVEVVW